MLKACEAIFPTYCCHGAGQHRSIWEQVLQQPVAVEVLETVLAGGAVCRVAVRLQST